MDKFIEKKKYSGEFLIKNKYFKPYSLYLTTKAARDSDLITLTHPSKT